MEAYNRDDLDDTIKVVYKFKDILATHEPVAEPTVERTPARPASTTPVENASAYVISCMRTYLRGGQPLGWLTACLRRVGISTDDILGGLAAVKGDGDPARWESLATVLARPPV